MYWALRDSVFAKEAKLGTGDAGCPWGGGGRKASPRGIGRDPSPAQPM